MASSLGPSGRGEPREVSLGVLSEWDAPPCIVLLTGGKGWPAPPRTPLCAPLRCYGEAAGAWGSVWEGGAGLRQSVGWWGELPSSGAGFYPLAWRADGWDLLCGQSSEGFGNEVRVGLDHGLPSLCLHNIGGMSVNGRQELVVRGGRGVEGGGRGY